MREDERVAIAARVLDAAGDAAAEAIVFDEDEALTRFTHNAIHQNVAHCARAVRVRVIRDGRTGVAVTNDLSKASLRALVERARDVAALVPRDDDLSSFAGPANVETPPGAYIPATADATADERARVVAAIVTESEREGLWAAGYVSTGRSGVTIANTSGARLSFDSTACALNVKANGSDATGYAEHFSNDFRDLNGKASGALAAAKARRGARPIAVEPGSWTVILEPAAFGELMSYLADHFSAQAFDEGSSFACDGLNRSYTGENVTLHDDFAHQLFAGMPFDYQGAPTLRTTLMEGGIARNVVTDARYAKQLGMPNTGNGSPAPDADGPIPRHLVVSAGDKSLEELIAQTQRGLLVTRFWYIRPVDQRRTTVTGMTRDGTFLIENGELSAGVRNLRFNQSILKALAGADFANAQARTAGYSYSMVVPAVKCPDFRFTSVADF